MVASGTWWRVIVPAICSWQQPPSPLPQPAPQPAHSTSLSLRDNLISIITRPVELSLSLPTTYLSPFTPSFSRNHPFRPIHALFVCGPSFCPWCSTLEHYQAPQLSPPNWNVDQPYSLAFQRTILPTNPLCPISLYHGDTTTVGYHSQSRCAEALHSKLSKILPIPQPSTRAQQFGTHCLVRLTLSFCFVASHSNPVIP